MGANDKMAATFHPALDANLEPGELPAPVHNGGIGAAPRDASWYPRPDVYRFKVVHADAGDEFAACDRWVLLGSPRWRSAAEVPEGIRCKRRGCAALYAAADTAIPHAGD